mmetsp:Transcript_12863/g.9316  ORF Transcript_12863/g.9316 Transcript_12863/m.9316 type:complete len:110 (+) Transcript_12863:181-510(+)
MGFPDNGSGRYSKELSYAAWYEVNNGQRAQLNNVEGYPMWALLLAISGLNEKTALIALIIGIALFVARIFYALSYAYIGPNARFISVLITTLGNFTLFGTSIYTAVQFL